MRLGYCEHVLQRADRRHIHCAPGDYQVIRGRGLGHRLRHPVIDRLEELSLTGEEIEPLDVVSVGPCYQPLGEGQGKGARNGIADRIRGRLWQQRPWFDRRRKQSAETIAQDQPEPQMLFERTRVLHLFDQRPQAMHASDIV